MNYSNLDRRSFLKLSSALALAGVAPPIFAADRKIFTEPNHCCGDYARTISQTSRRSLKNLA